MKSNIIKFVIGLYLITDTIVKLITGSCNGRIGNAKLNWHSFVNI